MATRKARPRKRTHRKAPAPPKFVALAANDQLFALDEAGGVWQYEDDPGRWVKLDEERVDYGVM